MSVFKNSLNKPGIYIYKKEISNLVCCRS